MAKKKVILIVDDEEDIVNLIKISLNLANFDTIEAFGGQEALDILKKKKPDLILLDIMMPGIDGHEVCRRVKKDKKLKPIPLVMLTAKGQKSDAEEGLELGADDYIIKPFDPYELGERIRSIVK